MRNKTEPRASRQGALVLHVEKAVKITFTFTFTCSKLRAEDDGLVWQQILNDAKVKPLGEPIEFNLHELCRDLNWPINGRNYERARMSISRLQANEVKLENERIGRGSAISLIHNYTFQGDGDKGTKYCVWIHPDLILQFAGNTSTRIVWTKHRDLPPIARRLYDDCASQKQPFLLRLGTFLKMCASTHSAEKKWRSMVRGACAQLVDANLVKKAWIHADCVFCER